MPTTNINRIITRIGEPDRKLTRDVRPQEARNALVKAGVQPSTFSPRRFRKDSMQNEMWEHVQQKSPPSPSP